MDDNVDLDSNHACCHGHQQAAVATEIFLSLPGRSSYILDSFMTSFIASPARFRRTAVVIPFSI
jgi:hypothetical protein